MMDTAGKLRVCRLTSGTVSRPHDLVLIQLNLQAQRGEAAKRGGLFVFSFNPRVRLLPLVSHVASGTVQRKRDVQSIEPDLVRG
jgi:hypothetical protein